MPGLAVMLDEDRVHRMYRQQRIEPLSRGVPGILGRRAENVSQFAAQQPEPAQVVLRHRNSKKWTFRDKRAKRLATAQRVSIGVTNAGINQAHS